eukprot:3981369-Amphidinium_carterae.1
MADYANQNAILDVAQQPASPGECLRHRLAWGFLPMQAYTTRLSNHARAHTRPRGARCGFQKALFLTSSFDRMCPPRQ